jgi:hypothetical protein
MAFKKRVNKVTASASPDQLFRELPRRKYPDVLPHQQSIMQRYAEEAEKKTDVALQLPTGSGKTLVGLLIAEWRRRKYGEKIVYLCPTKQLVNQVVEQAESKYGLSVLGFTGSARKYDPSDVAKYKQGHAIAVTTYSSIFNTNPFFDDPDIIVIDDAHAAENYVSKLWSINIDSLDAKHKTTFDALCAVIKRFISGTNFSKLNGKWESPVDKGWVDKIPIPVFQQFKEELVQILDEYTKDNDLRFSWAMVRSHLDACNMYLSTKGILIRPLLPPTWAHESFSNAKQRIYMSATLGEGGDLERLIGRKNIYRLATPEGWDLQGVGRRFFIFPSLSLRDNECVDFTVELFKCSPRSLVLVPSEQLGNEFKAIIKDKTDLEVFSAEDIEESKQAFVETEGAVSVVANRYDGIDFPGDECRLLVIEGLPKTVNSQEQFLMSRIGASTLFNERIQTRVIQAIGRCTRSLEDYSTVVVMGSELVDFLADTKRRKFFHPELQAELEFGVDQSIDSNFKNMKENYEIFIENGEDWEGVNAEILEIRAQKIKVPFPGISNLEQCVPFEIDYVKALWSNDYELALGKAEQILGTLTSAELRGYRALWEYLAGSAAFLADKNGFDGYQVKIREHYIRAKQAAKDIPWLVGLHRYANMPVESSEQDSIDVRIMVQVEGIEGLLSSLGCMHDRKLVEREKRIREGLNSTNKFEEAHRLLGEHLGFRARKVEADASPDPWWQIHDICFVFEDHANAESDTLSATKARQVYSHPNWMKENVDECKNDTVLIIPVLVSPVTKITSGAAPHLTDVKFWNLEEFKHWSENVLEFIRDLRPTFQEAGDLVWRAEVVDKLMAAKLDVASIKSMLNAKPCRELLTVVD